MNLINFLKMCLFIIIITAIVIIIFVGGCMLIIYILNKFFTTATIKNKETGEKKEYRGIRAFKVMYPKKEKKNKIKNSKKENVIKTTIKVREYYDENGNFIKIEKLHMDNKGVLQKKVIRLNDEVVNNNVLEEKVIETKILEEKYYDENDNLIKTIRSYYDENGNEQKTFIQFEEDIRNNDNVLNIEYIDTLNEINTLDDFRNKDIIDKIRKQKEQEIEYNMINNSDEENPIKYN